MTKHRQILENSPLPQDFLDALQEFIGAYASSTFSLTILNATTLRVPAASGNGQVSIAINGRWRYVTLNVDAAAPGGLAVGENPVFVAASDNSFATNATPPPREIDNTDYAFRLIVKPAGQTPSGTGVEALYRQVGIVTWDGAKFTSVRQTVGGQIDLTTINMTGTLAARPPATANNAGTTYFATDDDGGTTYRSNGSAWVQDAKGVAETAVGVPHASTHLAAAGDALAWTTIHGYGTLASRPAPAASNNGYTYLATDVAGGSLYESNGSAWLAASAPSVTPNLHANSHAVNQPDALGWGSIHGYGTLAGRPAPSAGNALYYYFASDAAGGTMYQSTGAAWLQVGTPLSTQADARTPVAHASSHLAGSSDALSWGQIHGRATLASRPAAAASNANYFFFAYDTNGGTLYHSDGSSWVQVASNVNSQSDARVPTGTAGGVLSGSYPNPSGLVANVVGAAQIVDGSVGTAELANAAATAAKQADGTYPVTAGSWPGLGTKIDGKIGRVNINGDEDILVVYDSNSGLWITNPYYSTAFASLAVPNGANYSFGPMPHIWKRGFYDAGFRCQIKGIGAIWTGDPQGSQGSSAELWVYIYEASPGNDIAQFITNLCVARWGIENWWAYGWSPYVDLVDATGRQFFQFMPRVLGNWVAGGTYNITAHVTMQWRWVA